jgi:hypothetical protein
VVDAALGAFVGLMGMRGTAGMVGLRACFFAVTADWAVGVVADGVVADGVVDCARSTSEGGCEVEGVSISASEGPAMVEACDSSGSSVGLRSPSVSCSTAFSVSSSTACSREGRASACSSVETGALRRLLPREARGGKSSSGTESQGRGGSYDLVMSCGDGGAACDGFDSATGGELSTVVLVCGVEDDICACDCTEGVDGVGWGVCMRGTGGVREWTIGGV